MLTYLATEWLNVPLSQSRPHVVGSAALLILAVFVFLKASGRSISNDRSLSQLKR